MTDDRGLLGSLPKTRPGVESPRRAAARASRPGPAAGAQDEAAMADAASPTSGVEDLARAGIGLAAGAASVGLKLAGRAAGGIGKAMAGR